MFGKLKQQKGDRSKLKSTVGFFLVVVKSHLRPRSFFSVPPYLGLVPIKSIISGIQLANIAFSFVATFGFLIGWFCFVMARTVVCVEYSRSIRGINFGSFRIQESG